MHSWTHLPGIYVNRGYPRHLSIGERFQTMDMLLTIKKHWEMQLQSTASIRLPRNQCCYRWIVSCEAGSGRKLLFQEENGQTVQSVQAELSDDRSSAVRSPRPTEKLDSQTNNSQPESIEQIVLACFSTVLEIPATSIDPDESIMNLGLDSILTVEMSHILKTEADIDISATELLRPITIKDIVKKHFNLIS